RTPVKQPVRIKAPQRVLSATFSPEGTRLRTITDTATHWWDARTGARLHTWPRGRGPDEEMSFSADGRRAAVRNAAGIAGKEQLRIWDWKTNQPITPLVRHAGPIAGWELTPDGRRLLTAQRSPSDLTR